ncbi:MAG: TIGR02301 family protein [Hyphomicrobiaceae bacterium]
MSAQQSDKPYDDKLYRLTEILGAIHYLRELCGADDGQKWRDQMRGLLDAEGTSALRRATLSRRFNRGYRGYSRTYRSCTSSAKTTIDRFIREAIEISDDLVKLAQ